jgi:sulfate transport system permease protein
MQRPDPISESRFTRWALIGTSLAFFAVIIFLPLLIEFAEALRKGVGTYIAALHDGETLAALRLTLTVAAISVPFNALLGVCAAWSVTKYNFTGKSLLLSLIDLPFSVSPVISGLIYVLLFGDRKSVV